jgi:hypothetical protein
MQSTVNAAIARSVPSRVENKTLCALLRDPITSIAGRREDDIDSQVGARICNGLGIMRACLETQKLEQLEARMDEIADRVARDRTNAARERTITP